MQPTSGAQKAALLGDRDEVTQLPEFHYSFSL